MSVIDINQRVPKVGVKNVTCKGALPLFFQGGVEASLFVFFWANATIKGNKVLFNEILIRMDIDAPNPKDGACTHWIQVTWLPPVLMESLKLIALRRAAANMPNDERPLTPIMVTSIYG